MAHHNGGEERLAPHEQQAILNAPHDQQASLLLATSHRRQFRGRRRARRKQGHPNEETCRMCRRTLTNEHWRHLEGCGLRVCNRCFFRTRKEEEIARREAEAGGF